MSYFYLNIYKVTKLNQVPSRIRLNLLRLMPFSFAVIDKSFQREAAELTKTLFHKICFRFSKIIVVIVTS
jgi:hypothetical protein